MKHGLVCCLQWYLDNRTFCSVIEVNWVYLDNQTFCLVIEENFYLNNWISACSIIEVLVYKDRVSYNCQNGCNTGCRYGYQPLFETWFRHFFVWVFIIHIWFCSLFVLTVADSTSEAQKVTSPPRVVFPTTEETSNGSNEIRWGGSVP